MSQMNPRRRSTVHDLAALRLHRDGTRVLNADTNRSSRRAKYAVRDSRGNWIAQDAGGLGNVKQRRASSRPADDGDVSAPEEDKEVAEGPQASPKNDKGKGRARDEEGSDLDDAANPRARKRRRFDEDLSYLTAAASAVPLDQDGPNLRGEDQVPGELPVPSSDLLKCLHHFASTYYTAMGQLYHASREYRQQKKTRRLEKTKAIPADASHAQSEDAGPHEPQHSSGEEEIDLSEDEDEDAMDGGLAAEQGTSAGAARKRRKRGPRQVRPMEKDMYKIFDGSALMALGMLFQEHVADMLQPRMPDGWEKEMVLVDRGRRAEVKRVRKAKQMREKRHTVKKGSEEPADAREALSSESGREKGSSDEADSVDGDEDECVGSPTSSRSPKQGSSVPLLESDDDSDG
ncbi:hypothetical protein BV20DRAFT_965196 [Pilatotrama ljubarskyi]|nr:hypothetical protein BV20DRAFT_965196 [Pilatotrama ljubarskyi]